MLNSNIGQATASLEAPARRWMQRISGYPDIHTRQKWSILWPHLSRLPENGLRLLDAGCGAGRWGLELAARRPGWHITGVDIKGESIQASVSAAKRLKLRNTSFIASNILDFHPAEKFDVVLSVASAHYLVRSGSGDPLFSRIRKWLKPEGRLLLLGPRRKQEMPLNKFFPSLPGHAIFSRQDLDSLCRNNNLQVELISPCIGRFGTLAKQISSIKVGPWGLAIATFPLQVLLTKIDSFRNEGSDRQSSAWLLIARNHDLEPSSRLAVL